MKLSKVIGIGILGVLGVLVVMKLLGWLVGAIMGIVVPLALVAVAGFVVYKIVDAKVLGGKRRILP